MRTLTRNKRKFWYCLYTGKEPLYDEYGNATGESRLVYADPVECYANISQATGYAQTEQFGQLTDYDKVIVFADPATPIEESTVLFIDKEPEFTTSTVTTYVDSEQQEVEVTEPLFDYTVRRVARSLNSVSIAVRKVKVS